MGITAINMSRVSQNLRAFNLLTTVQNSNAELFRSQNQLSTGYRFQSPSEDPTRATDAIKLDRYADILEQVERNLLRVNETMRVGEEAVQQASDLVLEAHTLSLSMVSDMQSEGERDAIRVVVDSLLDQLVTIGNRQYLDTYLFSGDYAKQVPFELTNQGVVFRGDNGRVQTIVDSDLSEDTFTLSGMELFNAVSSGVQGFADLNPALTKDTRLVDLNGAMGTGVSLGRIKVSDGSDQAEITLEGADTVGDVIDILNDQLPGSLQAQLTSTGINIVNAGTALANITVSDTGGGNTALDLGIYMDTPNHSVVGENLDPRLTRRSKLSDLNLGSGINLTGGVTVRNGSEQVAISFTGTETVEDVLNLFNSSEAGVLARIGPDGRTIEVCNRISGADLHIEENGGQAATALGIRSMSAGTTLAELNDGLGVDSVDGDDFRITTADGTGIDINVDDLDLETATLQDLITLLNTSGGGAITAGLATAGNGITITDNTAGGGTLAIEKLNMSPTLDSLGLNVVSGAGVLQGNDVNPIKVDSPFTGLLELREALNSDDSQAISAAGQRLSESLEHLQDKQGELAAQAAAMLERADRIASEQSATRILQSDIRDVDMTEAIVRFQQVQTALQANLATASQVMNLSLFDYLR